MEAMTELSDLVAQNPHLFADKLASICSHCPPAAALQPLPKGSGTVYVTRSHLNALTALARFLSKCSDLPPAVSNVRSTLLDFLCTLKPVAFRLSFWPQSFSLDAISVFFSDLLRYLSIAAHLSPALASPFRLLWQCCRLRRGLCWRGDGHYLGIPFSCRAELPLISAVDAERLVTCLLEQFVPEDEGVSLSGRRIQCRGDRALCLRGKLVEEDRDTC